VASSDTDVLIRDADAAALLGCSKATFWRRVADGTIPRPIKIGGMSRWLKSEILDVIRRAEARRWLTGEANV
jgi:predicted DNA-binding transcriptional regulator AlpA